MKWIPFFLIAFSQVSAADFSATLDLPIKQASLFEKIPLRLTLTYPKGYQVDPALLQNNLLQSGGFGIPPFQIAQVTRDKTEKGDEIVDIFNFVLEPEIVGKKTLTFWKISFKPPEGKEETSLFTDIAEIEIVLPNQALKEPLIAPLMELTETFPIDLTAENRYLLAELENQAPALNQALFAKRKLAWLGWLALTLGALFLWRFRNPKVKDTRETEKQSARQLLKKSLNDLQESIKAGNLEDFYTRLVTHLRLFYGQFYGKKVDALTTEEFLNQAPLALRTTLQDILKIGDQVRFGHLPASQENAQKALDIAIKQLSFSE